MGRLGFCFFLPFLAIWTEGWVQTPKVGVKWGGMSKLVSLDGPFEAIYGTISEPFWAYLATRLLPFLSEPPTSTRPLHPAHTPTGATLIQSWLGSQSFVSGNSTEVAYSAALNPAVFTVDLWATLPIAVPGGEKTNSCPV